MKAEDAAFSFFLDRFEERLRKTRGDYLVPINNASYHTLRLLAQHSRLPLPPILNLNALSYIPGHATILLFVSEFEYGRGFRDSLDLLPNDLAQAAIPVVLVSNSSPGAVAERQMGDDRVTSEGSLSSAKGKLLHEALVEPGHAASLSSPKFHRAIGILRSMVVQNLDRPFNADATLAFASLPAESLKDAVDALAGAGTLVSLNGVDWERLSLLSPRFFEPEVVTNAISPFVRVDHVFYKIRFYYDQERQRLTAAPMMYMRARINRESEEGLACHAADPLLRHLVVELGSCIRNDISVDHRRLCLYDLLGFYADLRLLASLQDNLRVPGVDLSFAIDPVSVLEYYGPAMGDRIISAIATYKPSAATAEKTVEVQDDPSAVDAGDVSSITLIKTATVMEYERANDEGAPRTWWRRAGLCFQELLERTGLSATGLSVGIDLMSDRALTESYNRCRCSDGTWLIDRSYNTLSDESLGVLAIAVLEFKGLRESRPELGASTAPSVLNKVIAFIHYLQGIPRCKVINNRYGKTVWFVVDSDLEEQRHLRQVVALSEGHLQIAGDKDHQIELTEKGMARDWQGHLVDANRSWRAVLLAKDLWVQFAEGRTKVTEGESEYPSTFETFAAFLDCIGEKEPEWGTTSIAHLLELGLIRRVEPRGEDPRWYTDHGAPHKLRTLRRSSWALREALERQFVRRGFDPLAAELVSRLGVLPENSMVLELLERVIQLCQREVRGEIDRSRRRALFEWTSLFKHQKREIRVSRPPQCPNAGFRGFVVFMDLLGMKKLTGLDVRWTLEAPIQLGEMWAGKYRAVSCRSVLDGVVVCFNDLYRALCFCAGAHVHITELYEHLEKLSKIECGMTTGLAYGDVQTFEVHGYGGEQQEITGGTVANAYVEGRRGRGINLEEGILKEHEAEIRAWGLDLKRSADGHRYLDPRETFRELLLRRRLLEEPAPHE